MLYWDNTILVVLLRVLHWDNTILVVVLLVLHWDNTILVVLHWDNTNPAHSSRVNTLFKQETHIVINDAT